MLLIRWDTSTWLVSTSALPNNATYSNKRIVMMMIVMLMMVMVFILMKVMTIIQIIMSNNKEHVPPCAFQITDSETC